jgi:hypothetical protein
MLGSGLKPGMTGLSKKAMSVLRGVVGGLLKRFESHTQVCGMSTEPEALI